MGSLSKIFVEATGQMEDYPYPSATERTLYTKGASGLKKDHILIHIPDDDWGERAGQLSVSIVYERNGAEESVYLGETTFAV